MNMVTGSLSLAAVMLLAAQPQITECQARGTTAGARTDVEQIDDAINELDSQIAEVRESLQASDTRLKDMHDKLRPYEKTLRRYQKEQELLITEGRLEDANRVADKWAAIRQQARPLLDATRTQVRRHESMELRLQQLEKVRRGLLRKLRAREAELKARNGALTSDIATLEAHVKRVEHLLRRLGDESLKDVQQLDEAAKQSYQIDLKLAGELIDQLVESAGKIGALSSALNMIDLRMFPGAKWKDFREAVPELRETAEFFNSPNVQLVMKRFADSKSALTAAIDAAGDPASRVKVDEAVSTASGLMQWAVSEMEHRSKVGRQFVELLERLPRTEIEKAIGRLTLKQLVANCRQLSIGEMAITAWVAAGEQFLANHDIDRITNQVERRNALLRSFSPGGSHFLAYQRQAAALRAAGNQLSQNEAKIAHIASILSRGNDQP